MTTIQIWGDSWGDPTKNYIVPGFTTEGHTQFLLEEKGYDIENLSAAGHGNMVSISRALSGDTRLRTPDWVVWFHTEIPRDIIRGKTQRWSYEKDIPKKATEIYSYANAFFSRTKSKLILIEGQSRVVEPAFSVFLKPTLFIPDWRGELIGKEMPNCQVIACHELLEHAVDSTITKHKIATDVSHILHEMKYCDYFVDNCHPGNEAHKMMAERLDNFIKTYENR